MAEVSDDVIEEINAALDMLLTINLTQIGEEDAAPIFLGVEDLLKQHNVLGGTTYSRKLDILFQRADHYFETGKLTSLGKDMHQRYYGIMKTDKGYCINVDMHPDKLCIYKTYKGKIRLVWTFSPAGRIQSIDSVVLSKKQDRQLISVDNNLNPEWTQAQAHCSALPDELYLINEQFGTMSESEKYDTLLRYGHTAASRVADSVARNNTIHLDNLRPNQLPLAEIVRSKEAMDILWRAKRLYAKTYEGEDKNLITITYEQKIGT